MSGTLIGNNTTIRIAGNINITKFDGIGGDPLSGTLYTVPANSYIVFTVHTSSGATGVTLRAGAVSLNSIYQSSGSQNKELYYIGPGEVITYNIGSLESVTINGVLFNNTP